MSMDIEIRHLRILRALADAGSLTRAAAMLNMSQGSLSRHLQRLERAVGAPLLLRSHTGVTLTTDGEMLLGGANKALPIMDQLLAAAKRHTEFHTDAPLIRVGAMHGSALRPLLSEIRDGVPDAEFSLRTEGAASAVLELLRGEQIDVALLRHYPVLDAPLDEKLECVDLGEERSTLVFDGAHELADREVITMGELAEQRCVLPDADHHRLSRVFLTVCKDAGVQPMISYTSDVDAALALVTAGEAVLPTFPATWPQRGVVHRPLAERALASNVVVAWSGKGAFAEQAPTWAEALRTRRYNVHG